MLAALETKSVDMNNNTKNESIDTGKIIGFFSFFFCTNVVSLNKRKEKNQKFLCVLTRRIMRLHLADVPEPTAWRGPRTGG